VSRCANALALALALGVASYACKKDPAGAGPGPTVVVEEPGAAPSDEPIRSDEPAPSEPERDGDFGTIEVVGTDVLCQSDADCVPAPCCHPTTCVALADAPDCADVVCTLECRGGTMDCYGGCACQAGRCAARIWHPPLIRVDPRSALTGARAPA
jgi:hypothetical protein